MAITTRRAPKSTKGRTPRAPRNRPARARLDREQLVLDYLPLVRHVVTRIAARLPAHVDSDELFQVGSVGLVNASRAFDAARGVAFKTYAFALIRGAILDELRRLDIIPRSTREKIRAVEATGTRLAQELGRAPTACEIARALRQPESAVVDLMQAARMVLTQSLDDTSRTPDALAVRDLLACPRTQDPGEAAARAELVGVVARGIGLLPDAERKVITLYYREGLLLREIGALLGVTESRVSQIHSRALARLQAMLNVS